ncbi:MAG: polysaccharide deacetylase family protein [Rhodoglobus sp.]
MRRRLALGILGAAALGALGSGIVVGAGPFDPPAKAPRGHGKPRAAPLPYPAPFALPPHFLAPDLARAPTPGGTITGLPGDGSAMALTVDDGNDSAVVAAYAAFSFLTGMRLTFFLNGSRPSWTENAPAIRELVATGQVQLANHTWSHPDLRKLSRDQIVDELMTNHEFISATYGVDARPYFRPPYGYHNGRVDEAAASVGYTVPVLWYGSLSDSTEISDADLMASANAWLLPQHIVIGHANFPAVTRHFDEIVAIIRGRGLIPVTLDDVFARP